jgi:hypothetical protein
MWDMLSTKDCNPDHDVAIRNSRFCLMLATFTWILSNKNRKQCDLIEPSKKTSQEPRWVFLAGFH